MSFVVGRVSHFVNVWREKTIFLEKRERLREETDALCVMVIVVWNTLV